MRGERLKLFVPKDILPLTQGLFKKGRYVDSFDNLSLLLTKFCPFSERNGIIERPKYDKFGYEIKLPEGAHELYNRHFQRLIALWKATDAKAFELETRSRLVVGLGDESVYETSIRLHRNYGVPYIPGSALKGVAKHYAFSLLAEKYCDAILQKFKDVKDEVKRKIAKREKVKEKDVPEDHYLAVSVIQELFERKFNRLGEMGDTHIEVDGMQISVEDLTKIFGTQKQEGMVIFFDAFPTPEQLKGKPVLELDIMNPHYGDYYTAREGELKTKTPGDWYDPKPILFLTVPAGVKFQFAVALSTVAPKGEDQRNEDQNLLDKAKELLVEALKNHGVGAKTSLGYGRFG